MAVLVLLVGAGLIPAAAGTVPGVSPALSVSVSANPANVTAGGTVAFSSFVNGAPSPQYLHYNWTFGDGSSLGGLGPEFADPLHTYDTVGSWEAEVNVSEAGQSAAQSITITVMEAPISVHVSASPLRGTAPLTVVFNGSVSGGSGTYTSELWDFGDGHNGSGLFEVPNTYSSPGVYEARLTVTDSEGEVQFATVNITVTSKVVPPPNPWSQALSTWVPWGLVAVSVLLVAFVLYRSRTALARRRREEDRLERDAHRAETPPGAATAAPSRPGAPLEVPAERSEEAPSPTHAEVGVQEGPPPILPEVAPPEAPVPPAAPTVPTATPPPPSTPAVASATPSSVEGAKPPETDAEVALPPPPARPVKRRPSVPPDTLRLSLRIVVHIAAQGALGPHDVAPAALTQAGMAEAFGTKQNTIATILKRLEVGGMVVSDVRHVRGGARRMKVYRLTTRGEALAREVRSRPTTRPKAPEPEEPDG